MTENIRIGIKGDADFSQVEHSAKQTADKLAQTLKGAAVTGTFNPKEAHDFSAAIESVNRALRATGQAGRAFSDIKFPVGQFTEAEKHLDNIKDRIEQMRQNSFGRAIVQRASQFGLDPERPQDWTPDRFRRMYRDPRIADLNWQRFMGPDYQQHGPGHRQQSGMGQGIAAGARFMAPRVMGSIGSMGTGGAAAAVMARTAGSAALGGAAGGAALGGAALATGGVATVGLSIVALVDQLKKGYAEHLQTLNAVDAQFKAIGSQDGFGGLMDRTRELGNALQMSQSEAAGLAQQFIKLSNESDSGQALQHAGYAGRFARAFGMQPAEGATAFGRAQLAGIGETDAEMQKFAVMLSQTIQGSGMDAQAGQVMEQMVGYLANIEASLGREVSMTEAQGYSDMIRALYGPNGAMSSQAASNTLEGISGLGTGKNPVDEAIAMTAYGPALEWDFGKMKYFMEQPMTATPNSVFGEGGDKSRFEMVMEQARKWYPDNLSEDPRIAFGAAYNMMGHGSVTEGTHAYDAHNRLQQGLPAVDPSRDLSQTLADQKRSNDAEITNASADIAARISPNVEQFRAMMADGLKGTEAFVTQLEQGAKHFERLNAAIAEITGESVGDSLERLTPLHSVKAAGKGLGVIADAVFPAAEASVNPPSPPKLDAPSVDVNPIETPEPQPSAGTNQVPTPEPVPSASTNPVPMPDPQPSAGTNPLDTSAHQPRSWRNNNPGNLEGQYFGAVGNDGRFAQYATPEDGWKAMEQQLLRYFDGKTTGEELRTVRNIIGAWSPAADPINAPGTTTAYARRVADEIGVGLDEELDLRGKPQKRRDLLSAMATHEAGRDTPYGSELGKSRPQTPPLPDVDTNPRPAPPSANLTQPPERADKPQPEPVPSASVNPLQTPERADRPQPIPDVPSVNVNPVPTPEPQPSAGTNPTETPEPVLSARTNPIPTPNTEVPSANTNPLQTPEPQPSAGTNPIETPEPVPSADTNPLAKPGDLEIEDMSDPSFHYGKSASANAQPFEGIVFHHTRKDSDKDAEFYAEYGKRVDPGRGGAFGYHVYIDRDGQVIQGAPWDKRTNHIKPTEDVDLSNRNAIGVSLIGAEGGNETPEQMASARQVAEMLVNKFGIDPSKIYGHGEIQGNRQASEGVPAAQMMREVFEQQRQQTAQFMQQFGKRPDEWLSTGALLQSMQTPAWASSEPPTRPPETPRVLKDQQASLMRQQQMLAAADLNININNQRADGGITTQRYNLSVGEPSVLGSAMGAVKDRATWEYEALS